MTTTDGRQNNAAFDRESQPNKDDHRRHRGRLDSSDGSEHHQGLAEGKRRVAPPRDAAAISAGPVSGGVVIDRRAAKLIASLVDERVMVRRGS